MLIGTIGCGVDALGVIFKYFVADKRAWPFYTLCLLCGWTMFSLAQLLVLCSRLHLVNQNLTVRKICFGITLSCIVTVTIPNWVVVWPAYNPDPKMSSLWSPRDAIVERYTQLVLTIVELIISGVYVYSLLGLLRVKSSVRQRRVMLDLIYVNIITVAFDLLCLIMVYLNQLGTSHPIQTFSYIFKLRLEFYVLNQLMSVAARGLKRETFEEKRYHNPSQTDTFSSELRRFGRQDPSSKEPKSESTQWGQSQQVDTRRVNSRDDSSKDSLQISMPSPSATRGHHPSISAISEEGNKEKGLPSLPSSEDVSQAPPDSPVLEQPEPQGNQSRIKAGLKAMRPKPRRNPDSSERPISGHDGGDRNHSISGPREGGGSGLRTIWHNTEDDDDASEEVSLHMWEHDGKLVLEVPWFEKVSEHDV